VLVRYITLDLALIDQIRQNALTRVRVGNLVVLQVLQRLDERLNGNLSHIEQTRHSLEQIPISRHSQLLEEQINAILDEEVLVLEHILVELQNIAVFDGLDELRERLEVVLEQELSGWHVAAQHVNRYEVDEYEAFVAFEFARAVVERVAEVARCCVEVVLEHGLSAHVEFVDYLVALRERLFHVAVLDYSLKWVAQVHFVYFEVDFEQLVDDVHYAPFFRHLKD
jgi:hypothetical protein